MDETCPFNLAHYVMSFEISNFDLLRGKTENHIFARVVWSYGDDVSVGFTQLVFELVELRDVDLANTLLNEISNLLPIDVSTNVVMMAFEKGLVPWAQAAAFFKLNQGRHNY